MRYIQLVEFNSSHPPDEVREVLDDWLAATKGERTLQTAIVATDHERPTHFWELLEYESQQAATNAMELPETAAAYERWTQLLDGDPTFHNLDVVEHVAEPADA